MKEDKGFGVRFFLIALCLIFIFCKLTGHVTWSWLWVLSPLWIPIAILLILCMIAGILAVCEEIASRKRIQDREDMQDKVNRKVADEMFNGEN